MKRCISRCCYKLVLVPWLVFALPCISFSQSHTPESLTAMIRQFKLDPKGPYSAIGWFCPDGTILAAQLRCNGPGGHQHAVLKPAVKQLAEAEGLYWGQILAGTPHGDFLDVERQFDRLKQYQMERYLQRVDDGWILRQARYYRGAIQFEDESAWGVEFFKAILADDHLVTSQFFLMRQCARDIPHFADDGRWKKIRADAQAIAEAEPSFTPLRIKLHGQPDPKDTNLLGRFLADHDDLPSPLKDKIRQLILDVDDAFGTGRNKVLESFAPRLSKESESLRMLADLINIIGSSKTGESNDSRRMRRKELAALLEQLRADILIQDSPVKRLAMFDLSTTVETELFMESVAWHPATVKELLEKIALLTKACMGAGYLEQWEWMQVAPFLADPSGTNPMDLKQLTAIGETARRITDWGAAMVRAHYAALTKRYREFEPKAAGFMDDRIRDSLLLPLGDAVSRLHALIATLGVGSSRVMDLTDTSGIRGVNPGVATGTLVVMDNALLDSAWSARDIVVMRHAPPDLKPVAGIATVGEGNIVSHVQLLARNLGIPNAVIAEADLERLRSHAGKTVFLAVSPGGTVVMKTSETMTSEEKFLFESRRPSEERIHVPMDRIDLERVMPVPLVELTASDSGRWCGPKAANLGQLKHDFPDHVVNGFVIPFGVFRRHMDQTMPETGISYWDFLQQTFVNNPEKKLESAGRESEILARLGYLRQTMNRMPLMPDFVEAVRSCFIDLLGAPMGQLPVFVRSDTNMEDLKDFTGAGLNLTVFNVRDEDRIFQAIRDVWASAYSERSFLWRQRLLTNPEAVYPSILIIPSVRVDKSGVIITTGLSGGCPDDLTVAFCRGAGGAVEGQMAETYRLSPGERTLLLSPAREIMYTVLPETGGVDKAMTGFDKPVLSETERIALHEMAQTIRRRLAEPHGGANGPWDIELGFQDGRIWLFQVRPFVANKLAKSMTYLDSLDPPLQNRKIAMDMALP